MEYSEPNITGNSNYQAVNQKKNHAKLWIFLGALAFALVLLCVTCPDKDRHKEAITREIKEAVRSELSLDNDMMGMLGNLLTSGIVSVSIDNSLDVDYYGLFSVGRMSVGSETKTVSLGILGHVFTFDSKDLEKKIDDANL